VVDDEFQLCRGIGADKSLDAFDSIVEEMARSEPDKSANNKSANK
jgi:hypothetical protein